MKSIDYIDNISVALYQPRIPQNTGNIARTCAAFNIRLHLIEPLGFSLESKLLKRSGLDYWPYMDIMIHNNFNDFCSTLHEKNRLIGLSKSAKDSISKFVFKAGDVLLFGREDLGLPNNIKVQCGNVLSISMPGGVNANTDQGVRSLNLASSVAIVSYQACNSIGKL